MSLRDFADEFALPVLGGVIYLVVVIGVSIGCYAIWG